MTDYGPGSHAAKVGDGDFERLPPSETVRGGSTVTAGGDCSVGSTENTSFQPLDPPQTINTVSAMSASPPAHEDNFLLGGGKHESNFDEVYVSSLSGDSGEETPEVPTSMVPVEDQLSLRALVVGCIVGGSVSCSNVYFGLLTGWAMGATLQSALLGYAFFRTCKSCTSRPFTVLENCVTQTAGSAASSMSFAGGFIGPILALTKGVQEKTKDDGETRDFNVWWLVFWTFSVAFAGLLIAVPMRKQVLLREKLRFPSGTATAEIIKSLHGNGGPDSAMAKVKVMGTGMALSASATLLCYFIPILQKVPVFSIVGLTSLTKWGWSLYMSFAFFGLGLLVTPNIAVSQLLGSFIAYGVIGPLSVAFGLASKDLIGSHDLKGPYGYILYSALAVMITDSLIHLAISIVSYIKTMIAQTRSTNQDVIADPAPKEHQIPIIAWLPGLVFTSFFTIVFVSASFDMPLVISIAAILLSFILAPVGIRATGQTDVNPASGIAKVSQIVFAILAPGNLVHNLVAGAIAQAGTAQSADMMQDLKTGHLLGGSPRAQFYAQLIGVCFSSLISVAAFELFMAAYPIPGPDFPAVSALAWRGFALLMKDGLGALPPYSGLLIIFLVLCSSLLTIITLTARKEFTQYIPTVIAVGIGMYVEPYFSVTTMIGAIIHMVLLKLYPAHTKLFAVSLASGLVAGEGLMGLFKAMLQMVHMPELTCIGCTMVCCAGKACCALSTPLYGPGGCC